MVDTFNVVVVIVMTLVVAVVVVVVDIVPKFETRPIACSQSLTFNSSRIHKTSNGSRNILVLELTIVGFIA